MIIGVGGFLGVGEKNVAVAFPSLKLAEKDGKCYLVLNTTKEALESAPGYTYDRSKSAWMPAAKSTECDVSQWGSWPSLSFILLQSLRSIPTGRSLVSFCRTANGSASTGIRGN